MSLMYIFYLCNQRFLLLDFKKLLYLSLLSDFIELLNTQDDLLK